MASRLITFASLPTELRMQIWEHAVSSEISEPRIHSIVSSKRCPSNYISNVPVPALIHTSSLSRRLYLSTVEPIFAYGTYINFSIDTLYFPDCPTPTLDDSNSDGFEAVKELGRSKVLLGKVRRVAVNEAFWLRPTTVSRSIAVDAWNVLLKYRLGGAMEELIIVFSPDAKITERETESFSWTSEAHSGEKRGKGGFEKGINFESIGWFQKIQDNAGEILEIDERAKRCDNFLRTYMAYLPDQGRWTRPVIKYVVTAKRK